MPRYTQTSRWDPFRDLMQVQDQLNRLFGDTFANGESVVAGRGNWTPFLDMHETNDAYVLDVDLPGVNPEEIDLTVDNNVLSIRGERRFAEEVKEESYHRIERRYGAFQRSVSLPTTVDVDGIQASFNDGVLRVEVPKAEQAKPRKIKVGEARRRIEA